MFPVKVLNTALIVNYSRKPRPKGIRMTEMLAICEPYLSVDMQLISMNIIICRVRISTELDN